jgi:hypothetical protein
MYKVLLMQYSLTFGNLVPTTAFTTAGMQQRLLVSQAVLLVLTAETGHARYWDPFMFTSKVLN